MRIKLVIASELFFVLLNKFYWQSNNFKECLI